MFCGRCLFICCLVLLSASFLCGCSTPQERSGHNLRPFNEPAGWENNPYYGVPLQN